MPIGIGDFRIPTLGDAIQGTEAMIGNVIEGVIEATTGPGRANRFAPKYGDALIDLISYLAEQPA